VHNSVWTCELSYGADTMFHSTYFLFAYAADAIKVLTSNTTAIHKQHC